MTDKNEKLFNAIGKLNDSYIEEAYAENSKPAKSKKSVKRIVMLAAAALLSVSLVVTVAANSDAIIAAMFERRQKLVDDKIGHIDESVTEGNITLTMDSVKNLHAYNSGEFRGELTVSFHNEDGVFDGGLKYGGILLEGLFDADSTIHPESESGTSADGRKWCEIARCTYPDPEHDGEDIFYGSLYYINYGLDNPSDTIILSSHSIFGYYTDYRLTFYDVTSYDGSVKYADKLSVDFTVSEEDVKPLEQLDYCPNITFEIEGVTFELKSIVLNPDELSIHYTNSNADRVNIAGTDCYAINYLGKLGASDEFFAKDKEIQELDAAASKQGETIEEQMEKLTEWMMSDERVALEGELWGMTEPTEDPDILNECYDVVIEIKPESGAEITSLKTHFSGGGFTPAESSITTDAQFSSPIYVDDIIRVYAQKIGDPTKQVTIWVPAEDKGLDAFR